MRNSFFKKAAVSALSVVTAASMLPVFSLTSVAAEKLEWKTGDDGKQYWYEDGVLQGTYGSPGNVWFDGSDRGREIYDPESDAWYWLDTCYGGAKAVNKEVFIPYVYSFQDGMSDEAIEAIAYESNTCAENTDNAKLGFQVMNAMKEEGGKWVRYDENGKMMKGWVYIDDELAKIYPDQAGNLYYYDIRTGVMATGVVEIGGVNYSFDRTTGDCEGFTTEPTDEEVANGALEWLEVQQEIKTPDGVTMGRETYEYDKYGRQTLFKEFYVNSHGNANGQVEYTEYLGNETITEYEEGTVSEGGRKSETRISYNESGEKTETYVTEYSGGREIKGTCTNHENPEYSHVKTYVYDESGVHVKDVFEYPNDPYSNHTVVYSYDEKGRCVLTERFNKDGNLIGKETSTFNDKGLEVESKNYAMVNGSLTLVWHNTYEFDADYHMTKSSGYRVDEGEETLNNYTVYTYETDAYGYENQTSSMSYYKIQDEMIFDGGSEYQYTDLPDSCSKIEKHFSRDWENPSTEKPADPSRITYYYSYMFPDDAEAGDTYSGCCEKVYDKNMELMQITTCEYKCVEITYQ